MLPPGFKEDFELIYQELTSQGYDLNDTGVRAGEESDGGQPRVLSRHMSARINAFGMSASAGGDADSNSNPNPNPNPNAGPDHDQTSTSGVGVGVGVGVDHSGDGANDVLVTLVDGSTANVQGTSTMEGQTQSQSQNNNNHNDINSHNNNTDNSTDSLQAVQADDGGVEVNGGGSGVASAVSSLLDKIHQQQQQQQHYHSLDSHHSHDDHASVQSILSSPSSPTNSRAPTPSGSRKHVKTKSKAEQEEADHLKQSVTTAVRNLKGDHSPLRGT